MAGYAKYRTDDEVRTRRNLSTWIYKYKRNSNGLVPVGKSPWYYFGLYTPAYKEKFPLSTTLLVSFTDAWHLWSNIRDWSLISAGVYYNYGATCKTIIFIIIFVVVMRTTFTLFFDIKIIKLIKIMYTKFKNWFKNLNSGASMIVFALFLLPVVVVPKLIPELNAELAAAARFILGCGIIFWLLNIKNSK